MKRLPGVFQARKKNGDIYFRSSVTFRGKHISLGSFATQEEAHRTYTIAANLLKSEIRFLPDDYRPCELPFSKWVVLNNFKNNGLYIKTPIYLQANYFEYYLSREDVLLFDADDLFYYSHHSIMRRGVIFLWQIMECRSISHPVMGSKTLPWRTGIIVL